MTAYDVCIAGAGIGGASLAWALLRAAPNLKVAILEAEDSPGYHTTGRSAAFYAELYGGPAIRPLTSGSKDFFLRPPRDFCDVALVYPRGALHVCDTNPHVPLEGIDEPPGRAPTRGPEALDALEAEFEAGNVPHQRLGPAGVQAKAPFLRAPWATTALWEPGCLDLDVAALHGAYLSGARRMGADLLLKSPLTAAHRDGAAWRITAGEHALTAATLVNAAGAWADGVAKLAGAAPIGIAPLRRTIVVAAVTPPAAADLPVVMDAGGAIYFKPDAGRLWISPHDETPDTPHDVQPDEIDSAIALHRFEEMCDWPVERMASRWAGLRVFAPDRLPVLGWDDTTPGLFWCAGQGGWGIQTAPAAAADAADLLLGRDGHPDIAAFAPSRFQA